MSHGSEKIWFSNLLSNVRIFLLRVYIFFKAPKRSINTLFTKNLWTSIREMPIYYWQEIIETGDLIHLYKPKRKGLYTSRLMWVWDDLQQQHLDEFGIDPTLRARIKAMKKLVDLNIKFIETRDRSLLNLINIEEHKLEQTIKSHSVRFYKVLDAVSTYKGFRVDPKKTTVIEWYHALNNMSNGEGN